MLSIIMKIKNDSKNNIFYNKKIDISDIEKHMLYGRLCDKIGIFTCQ